jgi:molybdopterin converting factor small subunit
LTESLKTVVVAINREFAFDDALIPAGGEVALFPPVSGG